MGQAAAGLCRGRHAGAADVCGAAGSRVQQMRSMRYAVCESDKRVGCTPLHSEEIEEAELEEFDTVGLSQSREMCRNRRRSVVVRWDVEVTRTCTGHLLCTHLLPLLRHGEVEERNGGGTPPS